MTSQTFPTISSAESDAYELLTVCYIRGSQISERIRTMETDHKQVEVVHEQVMQDLKKKAGSIVHGPSRSNVKQRAEHLKRCREVFDGNLQTLYE